MTPDVFEPGDVLGGKYRVVRALGEGGMAVVLEAVHIKLGHKVALKVMRERLAKNDAVVSRFEREGRALSKLRSANVVRVFDVDATPAGAPFLVMEYLEGGDVEVELRRRGALPIGEAIAYVLQACGAMQEAHALGIVHRDLKPTNLFLAQEGTTRVLKVLDFGIAIDAPVADEVRLTRTETVMGTPLYMAPEQFRSARDVDARADIWALGATLYELLTGVPPFTGSATTIGVAIVNDDVRPIEALRADVPPGLGNVVRRALEKDRERRFQTVQAFGDALRPFGEGVVIAMRSSAHSVHPDTDHAADTLLAASDGLPVVTATRPMSPATGGAVTHDPTTARTPGRSTRWWPLAALTLLLGAAGLFAALRSTTQTPVTAIPSAVPTPQTVVTSVASESPVPAPVPDTSGAVDASPPLARRPAPHASAGASRPGPSAVPRASADPSNHPLFFPR